MRKVNMRSRIGLLAVSVVTSHVLVPLPLHSRTTCVRSFAKIRDDILNLLKQKEANQYHKIMV